MYKSFRPGKTWYDTDGKRIQAHGGSILYADGVFYWYGENKEGITGTATGEKCPYWHHGVRLYSSTDLYNWKDEGLIAYNTDDESKPFHPTQIMDRPHILYNQKTKQFVLWAKCSTVPYQQVKECSFAVCVSEDIRAPFRFVAENYYGDFRAGDFDLFEEGDKAYIVYENPHDKMICQTLSEDYLSLTSEFSEHLPRKCPPFTREAPAYFKRGGRKFLLTSGTTGYYPNPSQIDEMASPHGEWKTLGDPCLNDFTHNSFHAQFSSVFKHPFVDDLYIALGDRWLTDLTYDLPDMNKVLHAMFDPAAEPLPEGLRLEELSDENTSEADYVWLPVLFREDGTPYLEWKREWTIDDFKTRI